MLLAFALKEQRQSLSLSLNCLIRNRKKFFCVTGKPEQQLGSHEFLWMFTGRWGLEPLKECKSLEERSLPEEVSGPQKGVWSVYFPLQKNSGCFSERGYKRGSLEWEWVTVRTPPWCWQPTPALAHSFCFLGMIISCWHCECLSGVKRKEKYGHLLFLEWVVFYAW